MRFVQVYDATMRALGWFVVANAVLTFFSILLGLAGFTILAGLDQVWLHVSVALSATLFLLSVFDGRLQRSVQVYNDQRQAEGRRPRFSDYFVRSVGGSAIAAAMSFLLWGEMMILIFTHDLRSSPHAFAAFFGLIVVVVQAFKYDPEIRKRVIATFPYDPGEAPVPPSPRAVLWAGAIILLCVITGVGCAVKIWHLPL